MWRSARPNSRRFKLALALAGLAALAIAPARCFAGQQDTSSTQAYLKAVYELQSAYLAQVPQMRSAAEAFAGQVKAGCPGALSGLGPAQQPETRTRASGLRAFGEQALHREQLSLLENELEVAGHDALFAQDQQAFLAFETAVATLRWETATVQTTVADDLQAERSELFSAPPAICQDIESWAASGHRLLSAGTRAFIAGQESQEQHEHGVAIGPLLEHFETSEGRALAAKTAQVEKLYAHEFASIDEILESAREAVGLGPGISVGSPRQIEQVEHTKQLGGGHTAAGGAFRVRVVKGSGSCAFRIEVQDSGGSPVSKQAICASHAHATVQRVRCEEGERVVEATMPAEVREVTLSLSRGHVTSRTIALPADLGGPGAFYYQAVARGANVPVSMTELDAHGHVVARIGVNPTDKCVRRQLHSVSGGGYSLADGQIPGGPRFTITGDTFAYNGPAHLSLSVEVEGRGSGGSNLRGASPSILELTTYEGCYPVDYHIVYGILKAPADSVDADAAGKTETLQRANLPSRLHTDGVLVYGVFTGAIESIVIDTPNGQTVSTENLSQATLEQQQYCEGFIEPGRAPREEGTLF